MMVNVLFTVFAVLCIASIVLVWLKQNTVSKKLDALLEDKDARPEAILSVVGQVQHQLGRLEESNKRVFELGQGLQDLKNILKNSKLRGGMGEVLLEGLLHQVLPPSNYRIQYSFKSGEVVDAAVLVGDKIIPIDSKFPLESFVRLSALPDSDPEGQKREKKAFSQSIKKHADSISAKYIKQAENTLDFALMFIPAENVYYEVIVGSDTSENSLYSYLLSKRVIPVSPNLLYAYIQVIILGLRGMAIEKNAASIVGGLSNIEDDIKRLTEGLGLTNKHLKNAISSHEDCLKRIDKVQQKCEQLSSVDEKGLDRQ